MKKDTKKKPKKLMAKEFDKLAEAGEDLACAWRIASHVVKSSSYLFFP